MGQLNKLYKTKRTKFTPGTPGFAGSPGQPFVPAGKRSSSVTTYVPSIRIFNPLEYVEVGPGGSIPAGATPVYKQAQSGGNSAGGSYELVVTGYYPARPSAGGGYVTTYVDVWSDGQPYIPPSAPIPPTPSQMSVDLQLGWDGAAISKSVLEGDGWYSFKVYQGNAGAIVGLNNVDVPDGFYDILHGFSFQNGIVKVIQSGVLIEATRQMFQTTDVFKIHRLSGVIEYSINGDVVYTEDDATEGMLFLDVSLYSGDDYIYDPVFNETNNGGGSMLFQPLDSFGGSGSASRSIGRLQPLIGRGRNAGKPCTNYLQPIQAMAGDKTYGAAVLRFQALTARGEGGRPVPSYARSINAMYAFIGAGYGLTGEVGGGTNAIAPLNGVSSDHAYGYCGVSLPKIRTIANAYEGNNEASIGEFFIAFDGMGADYEVLLAINTRLGIATTFAVSIEQSARLDTSLSIIDSITLASIEQALIETNIRFVSSEAWATGDETEVWVVNSETNAFSRYDGFNFNSFAKIGEKYYGCRDDGVYLLDGVTDNGQAVRAMIDLGTKSFGTSELKSVPNAYIGVSSTGVMILKVIVEGDEYLYKARDYSESMQTQRIDLGRGLRANYFNFQIFNSEGADFSLDSIEFLAIPLSRRI